MYLLPRLDTFYLCITALCVLFVSPWHIAPASFVKFSMIPTAFIRMPTVILASRISVVILCNLMALFNVVVRALTEDFVGSETGSIVCALEACRFPRIKTGRKSFRFNRGVFFCGFGCETTRMLTRFTRMFFYQDVFFVSRGFDLGLDRFGDFNTCKESNKITSNRLDPEQWSHLSQALNWFLWIFHI